MKLISQVFIIIGILMYGCLFAQELPPIEGFSPQEYDADNQNWDISQASNKFIYVANNKGLLEYNGANWNFYQTPNETVMRSVHVVNDRIYTGSYMEFGYWQKSSVGGLQYVSLSDKLNNIIEDEEFWKIVNIKQWVLFQSLDRIYIYDSLKDTFEIIEPDAGIIKMFLVQDEVFFQAFGKGVYKIENGNSKLFLDAPEILDARVVNLFKIDQGYLVLTERSGFFKFEQNNLTIWNTNFVNQTNDVTVYSAEELSDETILLGTISNGLIALNSNGNVEYQINQSRGLQNNTILTINEDVDGNIWLGLDNGISFVKSNSPYKIYNDYSGKLGTIYASIIFGEYIYLGTNQGLFYKKVNGNDAYVLVPETNGQVWSLSELNGELFCGHDRGTFIIKEINQANLIANTQGTWAIKSIPKYKNLLLQGSYDGLNILEYVEGNWVFRNKINGFDISSRYFEIIDKVVFVSHEYKGVFRIQIDNDYLNAAQVIKEPGFEKGLNSGLVKYNGNVYYANQKGVFEYDQVANKFSKDTILSKLYSENDYSSGKLVIDGTKKLWSFSKYNLSYFDFDSFSNTPELKNIALPKKLINSMSGYENISHLKNDEYLLGTSNGYLIIDLAKLDLKKSFNISINDVLIGSLDSDLKEVPLQSEATFQNKENTIYFSFSIPEYYRYSEKRYQYLLEGYNQDWSDWSTDYSHLFENLPHGEYVFKVKGKIGNLESDNIATYNFSIQKPWYLSNLFIALYAVGGMLMLITIHLVYRAYYKNQRQKLLKQTQKDLELKELENKQQVIKFKNESLTQDIESKNRELAISTMSLIKKNEFLNSVKDELRKLNSDKKLNAVIKLIDKNINNTNDWEMFEEAFNNADKNFLKKIKHKHPSLTSNDLRLCAYLRLNLSSKEIAPLLNISVRSVEVKRYRLRKKMELEHERSLTDYILEL